MTYEGSFFDLFSPFALLTGLASVAMIAMQGGAYLACKTEAPIAVRGRILAFFAALLLIVLFAAAGVVVARDLPGYRIVGAFAHDAASNPLGKTVARETGAWLANYSAMPWTRIAPALGFLGAALAALGLCFGRDRLAFLASSLSVIGVVATVGVSMFPFILPSSLDFASSLTVWDASSSRATLFNMLVATVLLLPADPGLHRLHLSRFARQGYGTRRRCRPRELLKGRAQAMWYFSWVLGLGLACSFAILNAMWLEVRQGNEERDEANRE